MKTFKVYFIHKSKTNSAYIDSVDFEGMQAALSKRFPGSIYRNSYVVVETKLETSKS